jgi:hypothetical protein
VVLADDRESVTGALVELRDRGVELCEGVCRRADCVRIVAA